MHVIPEFTSLLFFKAILMMELYFKATTLGHLLTNTSAFNLHNLRTAKKTETIKLHHNYMKDDIKDDIIRI